MVKRLVFSEANLGSAGHDGRRMEELWVGMQWRVQSVQVCKCDVPAARLSL